jgi:hypothetical protein
MIKSKRFWLGIGSFVVWLIAVLFFKQNPVSFASGITLVVTPYIVGETWRPSNINQWEEHNTNNDSKKCLS